MKARYLVEPLEGRHERQQFDCGVGVLNDFLKTKAGQYARRDVCRTFVAVREDASDLVAGFHSLASGCLCISEIPEAQRKRLPRHPVPVVHLPRRGRNHPAPGNRNLSPEKTGVSPDHSCRQ